MAQNRLEQRLQVRTHLRRVARAPGQTIAVNNGKVRLLIRCTQFYKQVKGLVQRTLGVGVLAIHFVNHNDCTVAHLKCLAQHKARLWHRTFRRIHQQHHTVNHVQHALHLAAKIRMARSVHDVDLHLHLIGGIRHNHSRILGQNCDAALALQIIGVHHALDDLLILTKHARLPQQPVHQRGLAMVNVGNDRNIAKIHAKHFHSLVPYKTKTPTRAGVSNIAECITLHRDKLRIKGNYSKQSKRNPNSKSNFER